MEKSKKRPVTELLSEVGELDDEDLDTLADHVRDRKAKIEEAKEIKQIEEDIDMTGFYVVDGPRRPIWAKLVNIRSTSFEIPLRLISQGHSKDTLTRFAKVEEYDSRFGIKSQVYDSEDPLFDLIFGSYYPRFDNKDLEEIEDEWEDHHNWDSPVKGKGYAHFSILYRPLNFSLFPEGFYINSEGGYVYMYFPDPANPEKILAFCVDEVGNGTEDRHLFNLEHAKHIYSLHNLNKIFIENNNTTIATWTQCNTHSLDDKEHAELIPWKGWRKHQTSVENAKK